MSCAGVASAATIEKLSYCTTPAPAFRIPFVTASNVVWVSSKLTM